jgi:hypothetical protein
MTRIAAWAAAAVLVAGLVAVGVLALRDDRPSRAVVTATRDQSGTVDVTSTVTIPIPLPPSTSTPPTTVRATTTLPKAAVDVLNALGSTTTTRPRTTSTTRPPAPTTTSVTPTTTAPAPTTTVPKYTATLTNNHPHAFLLVINGQNFPLAPGQTVESVELPLSSGGDLIQVRLADDPNCGVFDSGVIFQAGARYRVTVVVGPGMCGSFPSPFLEIIRLP